MPGRGLPMITPGWWTTSSTWWRMKAKKTAPSRRRVSFAVDRDEIEVNSDWVEAVMASPSRSPEPPAPDISPVPPAASPEELTAKSADSTPGCRFQVQMTFFGA